MNRSKFEIEIASIPSREKLVAEIFYNKIQWVEISQETSELLIKFYGPLNEDCWEFPLEEAIQALEQAKMKLLNCS
jgi:hypothetical protein